MFTQPCFIRKNTPELRKKLEELGYKRSYPDYTTHCKTIFAYQYPIKGFDTPNYTVADSFDLPYAEGSALKGRFIDCGTNEKLFLALAALREDTWKNQWIVTPKIKVKKLPGSFPQTCGCDGHYIEIIEYDWTICKDPNMYKEVQSHTKNEESSEFLPHKATIEEIIEHFKDESYE